MVRHSARSTLWPSLASQNSYSKFPRADHVADQVALFDGEPAVVAPCRGIGDPRRDRFEFCQRLAPGIGAHPVERRDALAIGRHQIGDHRLGARLAGRREITLDIEFAEIESDQPVDGVHRPLPARRDFRHAAQSMLLEGKILRDKRRGKKRRIATEQIIGEQCLPRIERHVAHDGAKASEIARLPHHDGRGVGAESGRTQKGRQILRRDQRRQAGDIGLVVGLDRVAVFDPRPLQSGQRGFQRDDVVGAFLRRRLAGQRQQFGDVLAIGRSDRLKMRVVLEIVIAVRQAEPALVQMRDIDGGIVLVGINRDIPGNADPEPREVRKQRRQGSLVMQAVYPRQRIAQAAEAGLLHRRLVHERGVEIGELAPLGMIRVVRIDRLDRSAELRQRGFAHLRERIPGTAVGRYLRRRQPLAIGVLPEIVLRPDRGIDR